MKTWQISHSLAVLNCLLATMLVVAADSSLPLERIDKPGLHNVYRINSQFISGSSPEGELGFRSLQELGVRSVISVDGARPQIELARKYHLRYAHIPIGYDGISQPQLQVLVKAARELTAPIYVHCHHGQHRGPAAIAALRLCLDPNCTAADAIAIMRQAGTDPKYTDLYRLPHDLKRPSDAELAKLSHELPDVAKVPAFTELMVSLDSVWKRVQQAPSAGVQNSDRSQAAVLLHEHFREASRLPDAQQRPREFQEILSAALSLARELEIEWKPLQPSTSDSKRSAQLILAMQNQCVRCHSKFRDKTQP